MHVRHDAGRADVLVAEGDVIALNATEGDVFLGAVPTVETSFTDQKELQVLMLML